MKRFIMSLMMLVGCETGTAPMDNGTPDMSNGGSEPQMVAMPDDDMGATTAQDAPIDMDDDEGTTEDVTEPIVSTQGIPEGVWIGNRTLVTTVDFVDNGEPPLSSSGSQPYVVSFGTTGDLLGADGLPVQVGSSLGAVQGAGGALQVITSITKGNNVFSFTVDAQTVLNDPVFGPITSLGQGIYTFQFNGEFVIYSGRVDFTSEIVAGGFFVAIWEYSAILSQ